MLERQESGMTYVYRAFDGYGDLLYVGMTNDLVGRIKTHGRSPVRWTRQMASLKAELHSVRAEAVRAESHAIRTESPIYNVTGSANGETAAYLRWLAGKAQYGQPKPSSPEEDEAYFCADFAEWIRIWRMATEAERAARFNRTVQQYEQGRAS